MPRTHEQSCRKDNRQGWGRGEGKLAHSGVELIGHDLQRCVIANCKAVLLNMERDGRTLDTSFFAVIESGSVARG